MPYSQEATMENGQSRLQQAQDEVEEVKVIMLDNLNKASEREGKLHELEDRAEKLEEKSKVFCKTAGQVKRKKRWENMKTKVFAGVIVGVFLLILIIVLAVVLTQG